MTRRSSGEPREAAEAGGDAPADPAHAMGMPDRVKRDLLRRLARIRGQVEGVARMVEEERYCPEILQQCAAVRSALRGAEKKLLANHLERCASHAIGQGGAAADEARQEILDLFYRHLR